VIRFLLNDKEIESNLPAGTVMLDLIRYQQHMMGTKIGCREGDCGACTVLVGELVNEKLVYKTMTSCLLPLGNAAGKHIVTIEGINFPGHLNPIQQAMADAGATQCGFCTPGFIMSLAGYCLQENYTTGPVAAIDGNICRCTGYKSIEKAANQVHSLLKERNEQSAAAFATANAILPEYFNSVAERLKNMVTKPTSAGAGTVMVSGGTDLYVQRPEEMIQSEVDLLFDKKEIRGIRREGDKIVIGAASTVTDLREAELFSSAFPAFHEFSKLISSTPIRNMATLAGNFVNASPIGDLSVYFLALDARLSIGKEGEAKRALPLKELYKGYKQLNKSKEEYIYEVWIQVPGPSTFFNFEKVSKRTHLDIASVNAALYISVDNGLINWASMAAGGVAPIPLFLKKTCDHLRGKSINISIIEEALEIMQTEISPISDARGSKEYKRLLLSQLVKAHFLKLFPGYVSERELIPLTA